MLNIFKLGESRRTAGTARDSDHRATLFPATVMPESEVPLPEVSEGNSDTDWALWEMAVAEMDAASMKAQADQLRAPAPGADGAAPQQAT